MDITTSLAASNLVPVPFQPEPKPNLSPIPPTPVLTTSGHPYHLRKLPQKFQDLLPEPPVPAPPPSVPDAQAGEAPAQCVLLIVHYQLVTAANLFGIWCDYPQCPTADPDAFLSLVDLSNTCDQSLDPTLLPKLPDQSVPHADAVITLTVPSEVQCTNMKQNQMED